MSDEGDHDEDVIFSCSYNGKLIGMEYSKTIYVGGEIHTIECTPRSFFVNLEKELKLNMYGKKVFYKLPYDSMEDLKIMHDGSKSFERMCEAVRWTKVAEIFICDGSVAGSAHGNALRNGNENQNCAMEDEGIESDGEMFDEEVRVEENVAGFNDEDNADYHNTPNNSDCEEEGSVRRYETWRRGSGELKLKQVFDSIKTFKEAVIEYVLKEGWNVRYTRWGHSISEVRCTIGGGCPFRVYCSFEEPIGKFMIKYLDGEHTCIKDRCSKVVTDTIIAEMFQNDIRKEPNLMPKVIQKLVEERHNLTVTYDQCRKAKAKVLLKLQAEHDEQFARLEDYKQEILE